ncbi:uncharacterized protein N7482_002479 [Penicillium canariense]|uniref:Aminotransferase class I/classII large domain-containing protein n=1 Tax=Penicillium canariense TaxID=189055 RepID=A0A9W9IHN0_9EURO|nr:uncharacterized protein N7482_002479 [Penicillium canariense]KAJ5176602.1 hypothetical protein N7482_002479 [Penicillium canariense]
MTSLASFELPKWIDLNKNNASLVLAGSATPALSIQDLIDLSSDRQTTSSNLSFGSLKLSLGSPRGGEPLRKQIAELYNELITADHIFPAHGTSGANSLVFQSLLSPGDHVIAMYPSYTQLISLPKSSGVDVSYWTLDLQNRAQANIQQLKDLIRPTTKMIVLNNPNNPLGTILAREMQTEIVALARSHGLTILVDEIFRPLFHDGTEAPPSFVELSSDYENIIVTSSMSKAWGLSGTRIGWLATRNAAVLTKCFDRGLYTTMALSSIDEGIAAEALSERCRPQILAKHSELVRKNLVLLDNFISQHQDVCSWTRPNAGGTAFVHFASGGVPVDDVDFCRKLKEKAGVLLAPGSLCFALGGDRDFRGFVRLHLTVQPEIMESALVAIDNFLGDYLKGQFS